MGPTEHITRLMPMTSTRTSFHFRLRLDTHRADALVAVAIERAEPEIILVIEYVLLFKPKVSCVCEKDQSAGFSFVPSKQRLYNSLAIKKLCGWEAIYREKDDDVIMKISHTYIHTYIHHDVTTKKRATTDVRFMTLFCCALVWIERVLPFFS